MRRGSSVSSELRQRAYQELMCVGVVGVGRVDLEEAELDDEAVAELQVLELEQVLVEPEVLRVVALQVASEFLGADGRVRGELRLVQLGHQEEGAFLAHVAGRDAYRQGAHYL